MPECAFVELHQNQVSDDGDLADGPAKLLPLLGAYASGEQRTDKKERYIEKKGFASAHGRFSSGRGEHNCIQYTGPGEKTFGAIAPVTAFGRSRPAADASREVVERWLVYG